MRLRLIGLLTLMLIFCLPLSAAAKTNLVLILDGSGSMWGQIDGTAKIEIAKKAMDDIVKGLPAELSAGLVAYGHNRKGDCNDVQTLIPLGALDKSAFLTQVNAITPKGKTPMVRSIRMTAESIKHLEDETTILLVSDGKETCDPDPCNAVTELKKLGINFVMHVVGFDVGGETEAELQCMARAGGGEYFPAKDAGNLKGALDTVVRKAVARNLIVVSYDVEKKPVSAWIQVFDQSGAMVDSDGGKRVGFGLPPGTYTLKVKPETMSETKTVTGVNVTADAVTEKKIVFAKSRVTVSMKNAAGKDVSGYVRIVDTATQQYAEEGDHAGASTTFVLSPGEYLVDFECSGTGTRIKSRPFALAPGENHLVNTVCAKSRVGVLATGPGGAAVVGYARIVDVARDTYADEGDTRKAMRFFEVAPGTYKVDVECPSEKRVRSQPFSIGPGQENKVTIDCATGASTSALPSVEQNSVPQSAAAQPPKQTARETGTAAPTTSQNQQDMQPMVAQMQAQAAQVQTDAMAQMQAAMAQMQGMQAPAQKVPDSARQAREEQKAAQNPKDRELPQVADSQAGYGTAPTQPAATHSGHVGANIPDKIGASAAQTGGGLGDERPEQGHNPYAGMSEKEMQAAFARDMSMQGKQGATRPNVSEFRVGSPLDTKRHINTLGYRLDGCEEKAKATGRGDILKRIEIARGNLIYLDKQLKKRAPKDEMQRIMDRCTQEINAIRISVAQGG